MAKNSHGGKRKGAGRKRISKKKKKIPVQFYERADLIETIGGMEVARDIAKEALNEAVLEK